MKRGPKHKAGFEDKEGLKKRLEEKCYRDSEGHWLWFGSTRKGYGEIRIGKDSYQVSRVAMYVYKDFDIESEDFILHDINCSNRRCFNPDHLRVGNQTDNMADLSKVVRSQINFKCGHPRIKGNTYWNGVGTPYCKTCFNAKRGVKIPKL